MSISNLKVKVEFTPGTSINNAVEDSLSYIFATSIAGVTFDFNGIKCSVHRNTLLKNVDMIWSEAMDNKSSFCFF